MSDTAFTQSNQSTESIDGDVSFEGVSLCIIGTSVCQVEVFFKEA